MLTTPSSSGWRSASSAGRRNSGSSSSSSTPRCARLASPGLGPGPPPTIAATDALWCGARKGGNETSGCPGGEHAGHRVDARHLERLVVAERRQHAGEPAREHGLARSRRAGEQQVVTACGGDLEGAPASLLPTDVGEIRPGTSQSLGVACRLVRRQLAFAPQVRGGFGQMAATRRARCLRAPPRRPSRPSRRAARSPHAARLRRLQGRRRPDGRARRARARRPRHAHPGARAGSGATRRARPARWAGRSPIPPCEVRPARG